MSFIVAIDGPAGVGKGTIAKKISEDLHFITIDTGATYRCVTAAILDNKVQLNEIDKIVSLMKRINIEMELEGNEKKIFLNGVDITKRIRENEINDLVSPVSVIKEVREEMVNLQRKLAEGKNVVMEGRDIGTVVFPNADVKIFLDATIEERANRRYKQNQDTGIDINQTYEEVYKNIEERDYIDRNKPIGALKLAEDAILIDTTGRTVDSIVEQIEKLIKEKL